MKFIHGKCLAKCPAYGSFSVPSCGHYCGPNPHFKAENKLYHPNFLILLTPPTALTSAQVYSQTAL